MRAALKQTRISLSQVPARHGMCTACNEIEGRIQCPWCMEPFPRVPHGHPQQAHSRARTTQCLNIHARGEQWIEEVTDVEVVQTPQEECLEGEHLKFKAHIRGWKTEIRKERCQQLLDKNDHNLRRALLRPLCKDVLLIPQAWYPEHKPKYETQGWWYVPAEEILGRECKSCRAFHELAEYAGTKRRKESLGQCRNCQSKESQAVAPSTRRKKKKAAYKRVAVMTGDGTPPRRSERTSGRERVDYRESSIECDTQSDSDEEKNSEPLSYRLKLHAADPRYITNSEDCNRGDVILT
jgi:hypothetical protein